MSASIYRSICDLAYFSNPTTLRIPSIKIIKSNEILSKESLNIINITKNIEKVIKNSNEEFDYSL